MSSVTHTMRGFKALLLQHIRQACGFRVVIFVDLDQFQVNALTRAEMLAVIEACQPFGIPIATSNGRDDQAWWVQFQYRDDNLERIARAGTL